MKKKLIKKVNILNQTTHINYYNNYILYNYLNNYNLKYYYLYAIKRNNYNKYLINSKKFLKFNLNNALAVHSRFNLSKSTMYLKNQKDKFFKSDLKKNAYYLKNYQYEKIQSNQYNFNVSKTSKQLITDLNIFNLVTLYKELIIIAFILNLSKIYEYYKILVLLVVIRSYNQRKL